MQKFGFQMIRRFIFGTLPITVRRNVYRRQPGKFCCAGGDGAHIGRVKMLFILTPYIEAAGPQVKSHTRLGNKIVAVR